MRAAPPHHRVIDAADRAEARADRDKATEDDKKEREVGRGRLSTLDLAAEIAPQEIAWAIGELNASRRTQNDIRSELNDRLAVYGIEPITPSSFNRRSMKQAKMMRRLNDGREMYTSVVANLTPGNVDQHNLAVGEILKSLCLELGQEDGSKIGTKGTMELARAYLAVIQAQKVSSERRSKLEAEFKAQASEAIEKVAKTRGVSKEVTEDLRRELFGVPKEPVRGA